jgi:hypothetical protein
MVIERNSDNNDIYHIYSFVSKWRVTADFKLVKPAVFLFAYSGVSMDSPAESAKVPNEWRL